MSSKQRFCDAPPRRGLPPEAPGGLAHPTLAVVRHATGVGARNDQSPSESDNSVFVGEVASRDAQCARQRREVSRRAAHGGQHVSPPIALHEVR